jgi:hypothetical protein
MVFNHTTVKKSWNFLSVLYKLDSLWPLISYKDARHSSAGLFTLEYFRIYKKKYFSTMLQRLVTANPVWRSKQASSHNTIGNTICLKYHELMHRLRHIKCFRTIDFHKRLREFSYDKLKVSFVNLYSKVSVICVI